MIPAAVKKPAYEMPKMPTRPLWFGTCREQPLDGVPRIGALVDVRRSSASRVDAASRA